MNENQTIKGRLIAFISCLEIGQGRFEKECCVANGYVNNIRKSISPDKLQKIALRYSILDTGWLMIGEGDMLKSTISQEVNGDRNTSVAGNGNHVNDSKLIEEIEIAAHRKITKKSQEQIDRLLSIIEKMNQNYKL